MKIGELSRRSGLAPSAIRYYEHLGLLGDVDRVGGQRLFEERHARRLAFVRVAQAAGFSLTDARAMIDEQSPSAAWRSLADRKNAELEDAIRGAQGMKRVLEAVSSCGCASLDACPHLADALEGHTIATSAGSA